jgi:hypothetical protein
VLLPLIRPLPGTELLLPAKAPAAGAGELAGMRLVTAGESGLPLEPELPPGGELLLAYGLAVP